MAVIYHVEHGDTAYDAQGKAQGLLNNGLTEAGKAQVKRAARCLKGKGIDCIYSSPLARARESAQIIAKQIGAKVIIRPNLQPLDIGALTGKKEKALRPYLEFYSSRPTLPLPEGETFKNFYDRLQKEWGHQFKDDDPVIAIVSHGRDYALLKHWQRNGFDADADGINFVEPKSAQVVKVTKRGNSINVQAVS